jgi:hypothetical protein
MYHVIIDQGWHNTKTIYVSQKEVSEYPLHPLKTYEQARLYKHTLQQIYKQQLKVVKR